VDCLSGLKHGDELRQPPGPRLGLLGVLEPVDDRVPVLAAELGEERPGLRARIRPSAISRAAVSRLIRDHRPRGRRGVNRCKKYRSSSAWRRPSIHPKHSAISSTSG
jgi:hypothetical protein